MLKVNAISISVAVLLIPLVTAGCGRNDDASSLHDSQTVQATENLTQSEISGMIDIFNRVHVPIISSGPCQTQRVVIASETIQMNPSRWTVKTSNQEYSLRQNEIQTAIGMFNRVKVAATRVDSIRLKSEATVEAASCGMNPNRWTVSFRKNTSAPGGGGGGGSGSFSFTGAITPNVSSVYHTFSKNSSGDLTLQSFGTTSLKIALTSFGVKKYPDHNSTPDLVNVKQIYRNLPAGTYRIQVSHQYFGGTGSYSLKVTQ